MNQALHIFGKDTRHLRWEVLVSLALVAAYLWVAPYEWRQPLGAVAGGSSESFIVAMSMAVGALTVLIPVSWWLVITRAVQDENLVGDQQWWVTKPYDWGNLLGAKLVFLAVFVLAPIFVVECLLLARAGFDPMPVLPALGLHLAGMGLVFVLPLLAIATVTSSIARSTLTVLGLLLVFVAVVIGAAYSAQNGGFDVPGMDAPVVILIVAVIAAAIVLQYARRLVWRARLAMIGALVLLIAMAFWPTNSAVVGMVYHPASGPVQFAYDAANPSHVVQASPREVGISVPVTVSEIAANGGVAVEGAQATLEAADGLRVTTAWQSQFTGVYLPGDELARTGNLSVRMKSWFLEREAGKPVTLHLRLAVAELRAGQPVQVAMPDHELPVPGFGICAPTEYSASGQFSSLSCRAAVRDPVKTLIHVEWSDVACNARHADDAWVQGEGWAGGLHSGTVVGLNPVVEVGFSLSNAYKSVGDRYAGPRFLCPGTPITFTPYRLVRRAEYDATFANFVMPKETQPQPGYRPHNVGVYVGE